MELTQFLQWYRAFHFDLKNTSAEADDSSDCHVVRSSCFGPRSFEL